MKRVCLVLAAALCLALLFAGCEKEKTQAAASETPVLVVAESAEPPEPSAAPTPDPTPTPEPTATPFTTRAPIEGDICTANFPTWDTGVGADYSYQSDELRIAVTKYVDTENVLVYFVADVWMRNIACFRTAFANGEYGEGSQYADELSAQAGAILGMNGDYCRGLIIRNGEFYHGISNTRGDICVLYKDGTMQCYAYEGFNYKKALENGALHAWQFKPILIDDGVKTTGFNEYATRHPRCIIGYYEPGHYVLVAVDGRQEGYSIGMNNYEMVELMASLGCVEAFNLDGGTSGAMTFDGQIINQPSGDGGRPLVDMLVIADYVNEP